MGTNFEISCGKNLDVEMKMCFTLQTLSLGRTDFTAAYLKVSPSKSKYLLAILGFDLF